ncbi:MAG: lecithin retinol acyltransferase family protein [Clostridia bacterium]|nr:lecithin retinol acyltransferase family protein [Clostridia bacterium]
MKFLLNDPKFGDMIRVKIDDFYHYGIFVDDDTVIQFGKPPVNGFAKQSEVSVCTTDLTEFSCGTFVEVAEPENRERKARRKPKAVVEFAKSRIGETGYHILHNNCEHFAYECAYGYKYSEQTDEVRKDGSTPVCDVYVRRFPFACVDEKIYPKLRLKEILACRSEKVREEKFYVWKLLEEALFRSFRLHLKKCKPKKEGGKWTCKGAYFSLSHSGDFVCVAVSDQPVGVDFEKIDEKRFQELPENKICTEKELAALPTSGERAREINKLWTVKEAAFKLENGKAFLPHTIETDGVLKSAKALHVDGEEYFLTVVGGAAERTKIIADGDIKTEK